MFVSTNLFATPDGRDLMHACEDSLKNGFSSAEGMMCTWYVTPCDCSYTDDSEVPRVCLPPAPDVDALARDVTKQLQANPELLVQNADVAAGIILHKRYPCND